MGVFNEENRLLLGKREAAPGVAETLSSTEADCRVRSVELSDLTIEYDDESSKYLTGDHTQDEAIAGVARASIDFSMKLASGTFKYATVGAPTPTSNKLPYKKYMESAGFTVTMSAPTTYAANDGYWEFAPERQADELTSTVSLVDVETGASGRAIEYKVAGCMSTFNLAVEGTGKPFMAKFSMKGKVSDVINVANANIPTFDDANALDTLADPMLNTVVKITRVNQNGSVMAGETPYEMCINSFGLDTGATIAQIMCQADAYGIKNSVITKRGPRIKLTPMLSNLTDFNFWAAMKSMYVYKLEIISYRDAAKTKVDASVIAPRCQIYQAPGSSDNGFRRLDLTLRCMRNTQGATAREKQHDYKIRIYGMNTL